MSTAVSCGTCDRRLGGVRAFDLGPDGHGPAERVVEPLLAAGACFLTALINPYGIGLYGTFVRLLVGSGVTELIQEYQPMPFGKPDDGVGVARAHRLADDLDRPNGALRTRSRHRLVAFCLGIGASLAAVRAGRRAGFARVLDGLPGLERRWNVQTFAVARICGDFLGGLALVGVPLVGLDSTNWPLAALPSLNRAAVEAPIFHEQDWGGLIEATM